LIPSEVLTFSLVMIPYNVSNIIPPRNEISPLMYRRL